jgi:predicted amidohydrolase/tetratricopeptide (TPR) repeat protein
LENLLSETIQLRDSFLEGLVRSTTIWALVWLNQSERINKELHDWEKAFDRLKNTDSTQIKLWDSNLTFAKGFHQLQIGNLDKAIQMIELSIEQAKELGGKSHIAVRLGWLSTAYVRLGDINSAQKTALEGLKIAELIKTKIMEIGPLFTLGLIEIRKNNFDKALERFQQGLDAFRHIPTNSQITSSPLLWMGKVYHRKGDFTRAYHYLTECLKLREDIREGGIENLSSILFELIHLSSDMDSPTQVQKYFNQLTSLNDMATNPLTTKRFQVAEAFVIKQETRLHQQMKAYNLFRKILDENIEDYDLSVFTILNLCDLLVLEIDSTGSQEPLRELEILLQQLVELGYKNQAYDLVIEALLLQSKVSLIEKKVEKGKSFLDQALIMAKDKGLSYVIAKITQQQKNLNIEVESWVDLADKHKEVRQRLETVELKKYISSALQIALTQEPSQIYGDLGFKATKKYQLILRDLGKEQLAIQKNTCRVGIAQIGLSTENDILSELYEETHPGLFGFKKEKVEAVRLLVKSMVDRAHSEGINILLFPELAIDLNYSQLVEEIKHLSKKYGMYIIPGSYHNRETKRNISVVINPDGIVWEQEKHIPAMIMYKGHRLIEGIDIGSVPRKTTICDTEYGRIAIVICRDFLDMDLRVELKNFEPPIDLIFNLALTPVTADFKAAHFDARRSIYSYCFFANVAEFGDSFIYTPEKARTELVIPPGKEDLIYKDVDLFKLRSERKKWELKQKNQKPFIQSTRE